MASVTVSPFAAISPSCHAGLIATTMTYFLPLTRREGRKIAANGGILIEQLINPACHDGEIAANSPSVTDAIFTPDGATYIV